MSALLKKLNHKFPTGILILSALGVAILALGVGFSQPIGEQSKLVYGGDLWCVSNYIQQIDASGSLVYGRDNQPIDDISLIGRGTLLRRDQVSADSREEAEKLATRQGVFEVSNKEELKKALEEGDTEYFIHHFNQGATSPGPCIGTGYMPTGSWVNDAINSQCERGQSTISRVTISDNSDKIVEKTQSTSFSVNATAQQKADIPRQIKAIFQELVAKYPEIGKMDVPKIFITKYRKGDLIKDGLQGGSANPSGDSFDFCSITLGIDEFMSGDTPSPRARNVVFHELLHCWSGITRGRDTDETSSRIMKWLKLEETSIWPIAEDYSRYFETINQSQNEKVIEADGYTSDDTFYKALTDIFKQRGDKGDNPRILMAARMGGLSAFEQRLSYLAIPAGFSSRVQYLESLIHADESAQNFNKALKWIRSANPPPADYKTYDFSSLSSSVTFQPDAENTDQLPQAKDAFLDCSATNSTGPSAGEDYLESISGALKR